MVDGVVGGVAGPASREAVDDGAERKYAAEFGGTNAHGHVDEVARVCKHAKDDHEDDKRRDPAPELIGMYDLVSEESHDERAECDDDDTGISRDVRVDCVDKLCADDGIDRGPSDAGENVEHADCRTSLAP